MRGGAGRVLAADSSGTSTAARPSDASGRRGPHNLKQPRQAPRTRSRVKPAIQAFLEQNERVVHADEIVEALSQQGVTLSSKDPKATVVTAVLRMKNDGLVVTLGQNRYICTAPGFLDTS